MDRLQEKLTCLLEQLKTFPQVVIAFSGGVDSTFLAAAAKKAGCQVTLATACSPSFSQGEREDCRKLAKQLDCQLFLLNTEEFKQPEFIANDAKRCYYCKYERFGKLEEWAKAEGYSGILEGTNQDDLKDYRPGLKALAAFEFVHSPLLDCGFTKSDIRTLSKAWGLPTWNKPSAACLVSRVAYGIPLTEAVLKQIEAAEKLLSTYIQGPLRLRHHGNLARIECEQPEAWFQSKVSAEAIEAIKALGYDYVTLDLEGYRTGSMNASISEPESKKRG